MSDRDLVTAKLLSTALCCLALWITTTLLFVPRYFGDGRVATWGVLLLSLVAVGVLSAAVRWRFTQKLGIVVPGVLVLIPLLVLTGARRQAADFIVWLDAFWGRPSGKALVALALVCFILVMFLLTVRWVRRSDTVRLLE